MPRISVLMSVFNEKTDYIKLAISSILNQTYKDIELIIVIDNPKLNERLVNYFEQLRIKNNNIKIINNKANQGLANSMNIAFNYSNGEYIARMDADDISYPDRFEKQINILRNNKYDIVCSNFDFIDENSKKIERYIVQYDNSTISKLLPYDNTIHHPTVMMNRNIFVKAGKYRNFPCAQDYDLWLRCLDNNAKFYIIKEKLLHYRIRNDSVTTKRHFQQKMTLIYIQNMYRMRKKYGSDNYSIENYNRFLSKNKLDNNSYISRCLKEKEIKDEIDELIKNNNIHRYYYKIKLFLKSDFYRKIYLYRFKSLIQYITEVHLGFIK